jgi:hypothetical protein
MRDATPSEMQSVDETGVRQYANVMVEIKRRFRVIDHFMSGKNAAIYMPTTVETIGLQFRKILELIAFASLTANKKLYATAYANFSKHREASKLIGNLKRLNPDFYPVPIIVTSHPDPNIQSAFAPRTEGFLTANELIKAHGRCGKLLHAANPFSQGIDYDFYHQCFVEWQRLIIGLLNCHQARLPNERNFWFIQMGDFATDTVSYNIFALFTGNPASISDRLAALSLGKQ